MRVRRSFWVLLVSAIFVSIASAHKPSLTIIVNAPASTPADAQLFIAGSDTSMGNWSPSSVRLTNEGGSRWVFRKNYEKGTALEFKITLGSWMSEALFNGPTIPGNIAVTVNADTTIVLSPSGWAGPAPKDVTGGITGSVKYHKGIAGKNLLYARDLIVWLPPSYDHEPLRRYPVLYMHDGQNIIDPATSFAGADWRVDEVADSLIRAGSIEELIIVGIYNTPDRVKEYSDTPLGKEYAGFVISTVKPMVDSLYRTKPDRSNTAVMGSSMGGLVSFLFAWHYSDVFSMAGCISPAFLVDDGKVLAEVKAYNEPKKDIRVFLDVGGAGLETRLKPGYEKMIGLLTEKGFVKGRDLDDYYDAAGEHHEHAWAHRIWRALVFMFGTQKH
ncbi:MAG TPA: alpha/beta hydrolase-fold protein [Bacteroidota bacterium]|nr:alpha/beta hydrolase-fold protein [Bacteroidota bacterium]